MTPCQKCGTMLTRDLDGARLDHRGNLFHDPAACLEVQLTSERAKVEEARKALEKLAKPGLVVKLSVSRKLALAALEKLRGK